MLSTESPSSDPTCPQQKPCDERASHKRGLPSSDLSKPAIVDQTSFPKFSIREYVRSSRSKDIKANWPFSSKTLQLCLNHGLKDILPPFQPLRSATAPSIGLCTIENAKPESRRISSVEGELNSSKFAKSNEKQRKPRIESNCTTASEAMASKTCPVCKAFSSPSNTTLNAHIDQCLSMESTPKWSLDSKHIKHKFKPRKTKMMVDIYTTAIPCTLEDLDRRNGTAWAVASRPTPDIEKSDMHCEAKIRDRGSLAPPKISNEDGVYFNRKGTKLRILSAFNDDSRSKWKDNLRSTRPEKEDEGIEFKLLKRKKFHASKHRKFHNLAVRRKQISPRKDPTIQIEKGHDGFKGLGEGCKMGKHQMKSRKPHDSGCLRQWICSKRTGVAKKVVSKEDHPKFNRKWLVSEDFLAQPDQSCLDDLKNEKNSPLFSPENITMSETECRLDGEENVFDLKKGKPSVGGDGFLMKPPNLNGDGCEILSKDRRASVFEDTKFYESSENLSSFSETLSKSGSKSPLVKKRSARRNSQTDFRAKTDEFDRRCRLLDRSSESWSEREEIEPNVLELFNSSMARSGLLQQFSTGRKQPPFGAEERDLETELEFDDQQESMAVEFRYETSPANSFDPILIPGPPGSFLPSPGTMQSDEFQGNSSLTSSQVLSDELDFTDNDSSDSPISLFTAARFGFDNSAPAQPNPVEIKPGSAFSGLDLEPQTKNTTSRTKNMSCDAEILEEKGYNLNRKLNDFEIPPLCCCNGSGKAAAPAPTGRQFPGMKLPDRGESATSSSSHPVLRLMGKNLMVMNKNEEDTSSRLEQAKPSYPSTSSGNSAIKDINLFHPRVLDDKNLSNYSGRRFDDRLWDGFRAPQTFFSRPEAMHPSNQTYNGGLMGSIEPPRYRQMNVNSRAYPDEETHSSVDGRANCVVNMAAYGPKYCRDIGASRRLMPGI